MTGLLGRGLRFVISGGVAALTTLLVLYVLHGHLGVPYLIGSVLGFIAGVCVNFTLQKWFVFQSGAGARMHTQAASFLGVNLVTLALNTLLLYILVDFLHIYYLLAQVMVQAVIAGASFVVYGLIFRPRENPQERA
ncbi:MAG TPA: GtrA family protein [Candidatus Paceibacterota bacterium]|nr:GtrA family protein [Candidatus Paceibacterota bacterium]